MNDTDERILARQVGKTLSAEEMEQVNGSGRTGGSYRTGAWAPYDTGYYADWEWSF
ncbi:hypothetical protein [Ottowia sp.]|uniref:hypothetical protein n=1 Tax=Ottowia sp. TaxID=1898956 RepID=UPI0025F1E082|nr:hypothetical protein [Ottowia sp.]MBK6616095.1 hypothetical protein [Ottowia sp.]